MSDRMVYLALMTVGAVGVVVGLVIQQREGRAASDCGYLDNPFDEDPFINERSGRRDDDLADPGKPTAAAPMWQLWLQVSLLVFLGGLVILPQVFR